MSVEAIYKFDFNVTPVIESQEFEIQSNTNAVLVVNTGATLVTVNGFPINPPIIPGAVGESFVMGGNRGEVINRRTLDIAFTGGVGQVFIIQKFYTNI